MKYSNGATATATFDFGPTIAYGTHIAATPNQVYSVTPVAVTAIKTGLACDTIYHFRCTAANNAGTDYGADKSFRTAECPSLCGDSDGNNAVNIVDALAIARKLVGLPPPPTIEPLRADVTKDNLVSIIDALHIARYSIGLVLPPEVCDIGQPL